jgi:hypothetical protein
MKPYEYLDESAIPTATDNSGLVILSSATVQPGQSIGGEDRELEFKFVDMAGNEASCIINVTLGLNALISSLDCFNIYIFQM